MNIVNKSLILQILISNIFSEGIPKNGRFYITLSPNGRENIFGGFYEDADEIEIWFNKEDIEKYLFEIVIKYGDTGFGFRTEFYNYINDKFIQEK